VIGAQRSGTSSLYKYLGDHPQVVPSLRKEVGYFSRHYARGPGWYRAHFPLEGRMTAASRARRAPVLSFEATPDYLLHPLAPRRAAELVPGAKLIVLLRDPVDRALSHYHHMVRLGLEPLPLKQAIEAEPERLARDLERVHVDPGWDALRLLRYSYVGRGMYAEQLERWLRHFPRERLLILRSEDLFADETDAYGRILHFLDVRDWRPRRFRTYSVASDATGHPPAVRDRLAGAFAAPNRRLYELIGRNMGWS
jgi:hypothetical protein